MAKMNVQQSELEARFQRAQDALPPHVRVARAAAMFAWARDLIGREIDAHRGPLCAERLKWETAMRMYGSDPVSRKLIQQMLDDVSS
jgi:hypothetical protein